MKSDLPKVAHEIWAFRWSATWYAPRATRAASGWLQSRDTAPSRRGSSRGLHLRAAGPPARHRARRDVRARRRITGSLVVLSGDTPLMSAETIAGLGCDAQSSGAPVTVLTTRMPIRPGTGASSATATERSQRSSRRRTAPPEQRRIDEVNTGTYCFDAAVLFGHLDRLGTENAQGEYYLTDMIAVFAAEGLTVSALRQPIRSRPWA